VPTSDYLNLFLDAGISDRRDQENYGRRLDAYLAQERITVGDIVGIGERGTGGNLDLYVVHRQALALATERGMFNKRIEIQRVAPIASIARLRATQEGFKGTELTITANEANGHELFKIVWGLGGPDWVGPLVERQRQNLFSVISKVMDLASEAPARPSVATAASKAEALMDWAADVVKTSGAPVTVQLVEEHANMVAATLRLYKFLPLGGVDDFNKFFPNGGMPDGTPIETFDDLYRQVVATVGDARRVDQVIDRYLADHYSEFVNGCREQYA
jgi:hypothetical protein